jgi:hypothetical protein
MSYRFVDSFRAGSGWNCSSILSRIRIKMQFHPDPARELSTNLYDIYHCSVNDEKLLMMDRGILAKHVEFHSKIKFEKISATSWFYYKDL